jgi:hypothetical protein
MQRDREGARPGALLSVAESAAKARPLRCWRSEDRARVARGVADAFRRWQEAWGVEGDPDVCCDASFDIARVRPDLTDWQPLGEGVDNVWWAVTPSATLSTRGRSHAGAALALSTLSCAMFGDASALGPSVRSLSRATTYGATPGIAIEIAEMAWRDWLKRLAGLATTGAAVARAGPGSAPGPMHAWTGGLLVSLSWWGDALKLLIEGERVAQILQPAAAPIREDQGGARVGLTPVWRALAGRTTRLRAQTQAFELDLGTLAALRVGDVLFTGHTLDTALSVNVEGADGKDAGALCAGFLGKLEGSRAVELMQGRPPAVTLLDQAVATPDPAARR